MNFAWVKDAFRRVLTGVSSVPSIGIRTGQVQGADPDLDLWPFLGDYSWLRSRAWLAAHPEVVTPANVALLQRMRSLARHCELRRALDDHVEVLTQCLQRPLLEVFDQLIHLRGPLKLAQGVLRGPTGEECLESLRNIAKQPDGGDVSLVDVLPEALSEHFDQWLGDIIQSAPELPEAEVLAVARGGLARIRLALANRHGERLFHQRLWGAAFWAYRSGAQALYSLHNPKLGGPGQPNREEERALLRKHHRTLFERFELCRAMLHGADTLDPSESAGGALSAIEDATGAKLLREFDATVRAADLHFAEGAWESAWRQYEFALQAKKKALYHPACVSYREALRAIFPESGRNYAYALARSGQAAECANALELSHATLVAELTDRLEDGHDDEDFQESLRRAAVESLAIAEAAQINPNITDALSGDAMRRVANLLRLMTPEDQEAYFSLPIGHEDQKRIVQKYIDQLPPVEPKSHVDSLAAKRRELVDALQSSASDRITLDLKVFRRAMVQSALKPWPKRDGEDPSFDADQYSSGYSRCGHPVANCLPGYPLVQVATTDKGTVAVLSRVTEKWEVQNETLEIGFTSGDLDTLMYGSGEDQGWLDGLSRQSQDSVACLNWQALVERVSMRLGTSLMRPLVEWIAASHDGCTLITHGRLSLLPLHVAAWPTSSGTACVLDILDVAFAPSVRLLAQARENFARTRVLDLVAVVDPRPTTKAPIPCAKLEVDVIAPRFTRKWGPAYMGARIFDGDSATRYFVQSCLNGEYAQVVHVACHAITDIALPKRSGIVLSEDERLTASDLLRVRRSTGRLAVLSCCETALTDQSQPEEALSFPATFLGCGFAGVIGSLWEVDDASTALLMIRFYEEWFDNGMHPSAALRSAQRWLSNASRREFGEYLSDERLPWYYGRISSGGQTALRDAWAGLRNMLPDTPASERPFSSPVYWGAFLAFGV